MEDRFEGISSGVTLSDSMHRKLRRIAVLNERVYDMVVPPEMLLDHMSGAIAADLSFTFPDEASPGRIRGFLAGAEPDGSVCSRVVCLRLAGPRPYPWTIETVSSAHRRLMEGVPGCEPGRVRNGPYVPAEGGPQVPDMLQPYAEVTLADVIRTMNESAYHPVIALSLFWNTMELMQPFQGDNTMFNGELLLMAFKSWNLRGMARTSLAKHLVAARKPMECARREFLESGNPNLMASVTIDCCISALEEAERALGPMDVASKVDGLTGTILRNARRHRSFTLGDIHGWVGDISDQTFRSRLASLMDAGVLRKVGNTRGARYEYVDPFMRVRERNGGPPPSQGDDDLVMKRLRRRRLLDFFSGSGYASPMSNSPIIETSMASASSRACSPSIPFWTFQTSVAASPMTRPFGVRA